MFSAETNVHFLPEDYYGMSIFVLFPNSGKFSQDREVESPAIEAGPLSPEWELPDELCRKETHSKRQSILHPSECIQDPNLFSILPPSPVHHLQDEAVSAKQSKILQIDPEAKSELFETAPLAQLAFL